MALIVEFTCELPNGVHARPAKYMKRSATPLPRTLEWLQPAYRT